MLTKENALRKDITTDKASMEHRHFATIATILRKLGTDQETCRAWAYELSETNPRFDHDRFMRACKP